MQLYKYVPISNRSIFLGLSHACLNVAPISPPKNNVANYIIHKLTIIAQYVDICCLKFPSFVNLFILFEIILRT